MKLPRVKVEMALPEVSAFARLRAALFADLAERLPAAMAARTADRVGNGDLATALREALDKVEAEAFSGNDALVLAVATVILGEVQEVANLLKSEVERETTTAAKADNAVAMCLAPSTG